MRCRCRKSEALRRTRCSRSCGRAKARRRLGSGWSQKRRLLVRGSRGSRSRWNDSCGLWLSATRRRMSHIVSFHTLSGAHLQTFITLADLKATFQLQILGVKKNPQSPMYTQLGVLTKGTVVEVNVSELGMVTAGGKVVFGKYAQITNNPENDGCINAVLRECFVRSLSAEYVCSHYDQWFNISSHPYLALSSCCILVYLYSHSLISRIIIAYYMIAPRTPIRLGGA